MTPGVSEHVSYFFEQFYAPTLRKRVSYKKKRVCNCGKDIKTLSSYLFLCPNFLPGRMTLLKLVRHVNPNVFYLIDITEILLYHKENFDKINNTSILDAIIKYLVEAENLMGCFFILFVYRGF